MQSRGRAALLTSSVCCRLSVCWFRLFAIEILAQCPGGAWRTLSEWQDIFTAQGLHMVDNKAVGCNINLMVWKPDQ
jgi:hypothetical protein